MIKTSIIKIRDYLVRLKNSFFGHKNYHKFIVITRSRTGSNLLISFLNSHPEIIAGGELFRRLEGKNCKEVWETTFSKQPKNIKYVGFKIFYYHPLDSEDKEVWNFIKKDKSIKIIHLTRENMLRTVISREIADKTNTWTKKNNKKILLEDKKVEIDIDYCLNEFRVTSDYENKMRNELKRESFMELTYEVLVHDNQKTMDNVFSFLKLKSHKVKSDYRKQNKENLKDLVINYEELTSAIEKSDWSYLLKLH